MSNTGSDWHIEPSEESFAAIGKMAHKTFMGNIRWEALEALRVVPTDSEGKTLATFNFQSFNIPRDVKKETIKQLINEYYK